MKHFILDADRHVIEVDPLTWGRWLGRAERRVARTEVRHLLVLTSFLGIDISFGDGEPRTRDEGGLTAVTTRVLAALDLVPSLSGHHALTKRWSRWADAAWRESERSLSERC